MVEPLFRVGQVGRVGRVGPMGSTGPNGGRLVRGASARLACLACELLLMDAGESGRMSAVMMDTSLIRNGRETMVFCSPPDRDTRKLLKFLKVKMLVKKPAPGAGTNEILAAGGLLTADGLKAVLTQVEPPARFEWFIPKPDCSQQLWISGSFAVRMVGCSEDLLEELRRGQQKLCVLAHGNLVSRSGARKALEEAREAKRRGKKPSYNYRTNYTAFELIPKLVKLSPGTRYVITCAVRGFGISAADRARYLGFAQVSRVMGWTDSVANKKILVTLVRSIYGR